MKIFTFVLLTCGAAAFFYLGILYSSYRETPRAIYPKCLHLDPNSLAKAEEDYLLKYKSLPDDGKPRYIFDEICGAKPVIDDMVAIVYLKNDGRLALNEFAILLDEVRNRDTSQGRGKYYDELQILLENGLKNPKRWYAPPSWAKP